MKNALITIAKIGVSLSILYFLFTNMDIDAFWRTVSSVPLSVVILLALLFLTIQCISAYRWQLIVTRDVEVPYRRLLSIYLIGMFFNNFLPTLVGGDLVKGYYLYRLSGKGGVALASIFMDRYAGFTALMLIVLVALVAGYGLLQGTGLVGFFFLLIAGYFIMSLVLWVDWMHRWVMNILARIHFYGINEKIDKFYKVLMSYKAHRSILFKAFLCSMVVQVGIIVGYYMLGVGFGMEVGIGYFFLFIPLATAASMLPVSLAGLGVREGVFVFLFTRAGSTAEQALGLSLIFFAIMVFVSLIGGIEYVRTGGRKNMVVDEEVNV